MPLAPFTTFHIGGPARVFIEAHTEEEVRDAVAYAREKHLPLYPLGAGSNLLVPDAGVDGVVIKMALGDIDFERSGDDMLSSRVQGRSGKKLLTPRVGADSSALKISRVFRAPSAARRCRISAHTAQNLPMCLRMPIVSIARPARKSASRAPKPHSRTAQVFSKSIANSSSFASHCVSQNRRRRISPIPTSRMRAKRRSARDATEIARAIRSIRAKKFPVRKRRHGRFFF